MRLATDQWYRGERRPYFEAGVLLGVMLGANNQIHTRFRAADQAIEIRRIGPKEQRAIEARFGIFPGCLKTFLGERDNDRRTALQASSAGCNDR